MDDLNQDDFKNQLKAIAPKHCDVCGSRYLETDFNNIKNNNQQTIVHLRCHNCGNSYILNIYSPVPGVVGSARAQVNLDLTDTSEFMTFAGSKVVSADDALDARNIFTKSPALLNFFYHNKPEKKQKPRAKEETKTA